MKHQLATFILLPLLLLGCSDSSDRPSAPPPPSVTSLSIEPPLAELDVGTTESFRAIARYSDGVVTDVSDRADWSLEIDSGVLEVLDDSGPSGHFSVRALMAGQDQVVAGLDGFSAKSTVSVEDTALVAIELMPATAEMLEGSERAFTARGVYEDGDTQDLTDESEWASSLPGVASVRESGLVTAESKGVATVSASLGGVSGSAEVTVHEEVELVSVEVLPEEARLFLDGSKYFNAFAHYSDGTVEQVTRQALWISSDTSVVAEDIYQDGLFLARGVGAAEISAELGINNKGSAQVTVEEVVITHIVILPRDTALGVGDTRRYYTEAAGSDESSHSVNHSPNQSYEVSDPAVAYISNSPDTKGILTALQPGTTTVISTFVYEGEEFTDQATLTVCDGGCQ